MVDLLAAGYPSLDFVLPVSDSPRTGETALIHRLPLNHEATLDGRGANVAATLAKLGFKPAIATIVGKDREGYVYTSRLRQMGVDVEDTIMVRTGNTSRRYRYRNPGGEYQSFFFPGVADAWEGELKLTNMSLAKYALLTTGPRQHSYQFLAEARKAAKPIVWQVNTDVARYDDQAMQAFAAASDYILLTELEAALMVEQLGLSSIRGLLVQGTQAVVVVHQDASGTLHDMAGETRIQAVPSANLIDPTGLDDAFTAGFVASLLNAYSLRKSVQVGAVLASFVVEGLGSQANLPDWDTMQSRYETHFGRL